jgi:hypothetical protein
MSLETITSLDMNFSNGGGGHTASVSAILDVKETDGSPSLGVVNGEIGSKNFFSEKDVNNIMGRFICTSKTTNKSPVGVTVSRKYSDKTSLLLKSYLVLVRGINAPPDNNHPFEGMVPFFSEVKSSPLDPFPSIGVRELDGKRVLIVGKIYNFESTTLLNGVKASLIYQDGDLITDLSLNQDMVTPDYKDAPDLQEYQLKYGYTLDEYKEMLTYVGVTHTGLEEVENSGKILFENSGTLGDVTSAIASFFGFYYMINPNDGAIHFIDSRVAATKQITDFTETTDENVISASFTEDKFTPEIVNAYVGSADKPSDADTSPQKKQISTKVPFYRVAAERALIERHRFIDGDDQVEVVVADVNFQQIALFFSLFADDSVNQSDDLLNKYFYSLLIYLSNQSANDFKDLEKRISFGGLYDEELFRYERIPWSADLPNYADAKWRAIYRAKGGGPTTEFDQGLEASQCFIINRAEVGMEEKDNGEPRITDPATISQTNSNGRDYKKVDKKGAAAPAKRASYVKMAENKVPKKMHDRLSNVYHTLLNNDMDDLSEFTDSKLYSFLESFFEFAGGIYITSGLHEPKAKDLDFSDDKGLAIFGPFHKNQHILDCGGLEQLGAWLINHTAFGASNQRVEDLAGVASLFENSIEMGEYYFIGLRPWASLPLAERGNIKWDVFTGEFDYCKNSDDKKVLGYSVKKFAPVGGFNASMKTIIGQSGKQLVSAIKNLPDKLDTVAKKGSLRATGMDDERVNKSLVGASSRTETLKTLLDSFDYKSFIIDAPPTNQYTPLSLSVANGSTVEMKSLKQTAEKDYLSILNTPLKSSSKTVYGLEIPTEFQITTSSFSIKVGSDGITTTIGESTLKLLPPDQQFVISKGMEVLGRPSINPRLKAAQRNYLGL